MPRRKDAKIQIPFKSLTDSFTLNKPETKETKSSNKTTGVLLGVAALALGAVLLAKGKASQAKNVVKDAKLEPITKLAESISFKPAKTLEEAIQFGKTSLGIQKYQGFENRDLEVINWINEALTKTSNKMRGNLVMAKNVIYTADPSLLGKNATAGMISDIGHPRYGDLFVNKRFFRDINSAIDEQIGFAKRTVNFDMKSLVGDSAKIFDKESFSKLFEQYSRYKAGQLNLSEKIAFHNSLIAIGDTNTAIMNLPPDKLSALMNRLNSGKTIKVDLNRTAFDTIYHEMGHLQDKMPRCLTTDKYNFDYSKFSDELKAWVNDKQNLQTAQMVSRYAANGPGEFVAEVYSRLIAGKNLPEEVLALYRKLKGPVVNV